MVDGMTSPILIVFKGHYDQGRFMRIGRKKKKKNHSCLEEQREGGSGRIRSGQPYLSLWQDGGANPSGNHFQMREGEEGDWE